MEENFNNEAEKNAKGYAPKSPVLAWLDNFWYHYKWHTIIALFAIFTTVVCAIQMCQKESYDMYIMYAGGMEIDRKNEAGDIYSDYQLAVQGLTKVAEDFDGNGSKTVSFKDLFLLTNEQIDDMKDLEDKEINQYLIDQNMQNFIETLRYSDYYLCILSEELYEKYKTIDNVELFSPLTNYINEGTSVKLTDDGCAVYLSSTGFSSLPIYSDMPSGTVVCLRRISNLASHLDKSDAEKHRSRAEEAIKAIINYKE